MIQCLRQCCNCFPCFNAPPSPEPVEPRSVTPVPQIGGRTVSPICHPIKHRIKLPDPVYQHGSFSTSKQRDASTATSSKYDTAIARKEQLTLNIKSLNKNQRSTQSLKYSRSQSEPILSEQIRSYPSQKSLATILNDQIPISIPTHTTDSSCASISSRLFCYKSLTQLHSDTVNYASLMWSKESATVTEIHHLTKCDSNKTIFASIDFEKTIGLKVTREEINMQRISESENDSIITIKGKN